MEMPKNGGMLFSDSLLDWNFLSALSQFLCGSQLRSRAIYGMIPVKGRSAAAPKKGDRADETQRLYQLGRILYGHRAAHGHALQGPEQPGRGLHRQPGE